MNAIGTASRPPREAEAQIDEAVRLGRRLRKAPTRKATRATQHEQDSLKRALAALYEYGAAQHLNVKFKSCTASCHDEDSEDDDDEADQFYILCVEMARIDERSHGGRMVNGSNLAAECERDVRQSMQKATFGAARNTQQAIESNAATLQSSTGEYDGSRQTYVLRFQFTPPADIEESPVAAAPSRRVSSKNRHRQHMNKPAKKTAKSAPIMVRLPSSEECVQFYGKRASTWSLFGKDLSKLFTPTK